jgi:hypothetical protein
MMIVVERGCAVANNHAQAAAAADSLALDAAARQVQQHAVYAGSETIARHIALIILCIL